jgi:predicted site-specific integrase-resolvase
MAIRHLSQNELAARWNMSPRTLERWRWTGEGPTFLKLGGRVVYRLEDVEAHEIKRLEEARALMARNRLSSGAVAATGTGQ